MFTPTVSRHFVESPIECLQILFIGNVRVTAHSKDPASLTIPSCSPPARSWIEESLIDAVSKALKKAPPLTPQVRERILGLLS